MRVWRIEHKKDQYGPYCYHQSRGTYCPTTLPGSTERSPVPSEDGISWEQYRDMKNYRHGFDSIKKLKTWFKKQDRQYLIQHDFVCNIYEVKEAVAGKKQVIFNMDSAKRLSRSRVLKRA